MHDLQIFFISTNLMYTKMKTVAVSTFAYSQTMRQSLIAFIRIRSSAWGNVHCGVQVTIAGEGEISFVIELGRFFLVLLCIR